MQKKKHYCNTKYTPDVITEALNKLVEFIKDKKHIYKSLTLKIGSEEWEHDTEGEFFADYRKNIKSAYLSFDINHGKYKLIVYFTDECTDVSVTSQNRAEIESVFEIFEKSLHVSKYFTTGKKDKKEPIIFIGHGRSPQWRDLKDHLQEKHSYRIEAYEIGERSGHTIRDILEEMLNKSSMAFLVLTGEDRDEQGLLHARENVIHELGLFQGRLGFSKAIVLLEEGTQEFSNIHGIHQIRYKSGSIKETYGEVLAVIRREYLEKQRT